MGRFISSTVGIAAAFVVVTGLFTASPAVACDQGRFTADMRWCLVEGKGAIGGRGLMHSGIKKGNAGVIMSGFRMCQGHNGGARDNGNSCFRADANMPLRIARQITGR